MTRRWRGLLVPAIVIVTLQILATASHFQSDSLASPLDVLRAAGTIIVDGTLARGTGQTILAAAVGLIIGGSIGFILGCALGSSVPADRVATVPIEIVRPVPSVALIPIAMLALGFGWAMEASIVAFSTLWPIMIITRSAVRSVPRRLLEVATMLGLSRIAITRDIVMPSVVPQLIVGVRLATGIALVVAVTVEITANPFGLGAIMIVAQTSLQPAKMLAVLIWIGILGWSLNMLLLAAQQRVTRWKTAR